MSHTQVPRNERVDTPGRVRINGVNYSIRGRVQRSLASNFPEKRVDGDFSEESHPLVSSITWNDLRGGMLREHGDFPEDINRVFYTDGNIRSKGHIVQGPFQRNYATNVDVSGSSGGANYVTPYNGENYVISNSANTVWVLLNDAGGASRTTLTSPATDFQGGIAEGKRVLVASQGSRIQWTHSDTNDAIWLSDSSENITHTTTWRNLLWGTNDSAELFFGENVTDSSAFTWTRVAQADIVDTGKQTGLVVGDDERLYLVSRLGLHQYNNEREEFKHVMRLPDHPNGGDAFTVDQGSIYYAQGMSVWRFTPGDVNIVDQIGLDIDEGLIRARQGNITAMTHTVREVLAQVRSPDSNARSGVYSFSNGNWKTLSTFDESTAGQEPIVGNQITVSANSTAAGTEYSVLTTITSSGNLKSLPIPQLTTNPDQLSSNARFFASALQETIFPWVNVDNEQKWTALAVRVTHAFIFPTGFSVTDSQDKITVSYGLDNNDDSFTTLGTIGGKTDSDGTTTFKMPSGDNPVGVPFDAFRLKVGLESNPLPTWSPDVTEISLSYTKSADTLWGFTMLIDVTDDALGRSEEERRESLKELFTKTELFRFTFKGDAGTDESYFVTAIGMEAAEEAGFDDSGTYILRLSEVN